MIKNVDSTPIEVPISIPKEILLKKLEERKLAEAEGPLTGKMETPRKPSPWELD